MKQSRNKLIVKYVQNKSVLDIGGCGFTLNAREILDVIKKESKDYVCIDNKKETVSDFKKKGYNTVFANAEDFNLQKKFDVVHAGELIEHLSNPGKFLECSKSHLKENGILVISTPNAFSFRNILSYVLRGKEVIYKEHSNLYSEAILKELFDRYQLKIVKFHYIPRRNIQGFKEKLESLIGTVFPKLNIGLFVVCKKQ